MLDAGFLSAGHGTPAIEEEAGEVLMIFCVDAVMTVVDVLAPTTSVARGATCCWCDALQTLVSP